MDYGMDGRNLILEEIQIEHAEELSKAAIVRVGEEIAQEPIDLTGEEEKVPSNVRFADEVTTAAKGKGKASAQPVGGKH